MAKDWKQSVLAEGGTIADAVRIIDSGGVQFCMVVDSAGILCGTVTDGDVRRGILRGLTLDRPVGEIMNRLPKTALPDDDSGRVRDMMAAMMIRQIPIVDRRGRLMGLMTDSDHLVVRRRENPVVLMAGGLGNRLRPLTDDTPKPLLKVGRQPLLQTIVENFLAFDFREFYISVNYKAEMVKAYFGDGSALGCDIHYLEEDERLGTAGALSLLPQRPDVPFVVMNGDVLTKINFANLLKFHTEQAADATMCVREYDFQVPYGVVNLDGDRIASVVEKPVQSLFVNAGIYVIAPSALDLVPKGRYFDMPELFATLIAEQRPTSAFPVREYWIDIGRLDDLERANGEFASIFG